MGTITRSMNSLRAGVKGNGSSCRDDSERSPLRRRRPDVLPSTLTAVSNAILKTASCLTKMALTMTARAPGAAPPRWQAGHFCQSPAALMSGASSRQNLQPKHCTLLGVSHVVGRTLGSHAYRIGAGGACFLISIPVGKTLLSWLVSKFLSVGSRARTGIVYPCCRQVSGLRSRHKMVSNRETQRTL